MGPTNLLLRSSSRWSTVSLTGAASRAPSPDVTPSSGVLPACARRPRGRSLSARRPDRARVPGRGAERGQEGDQGEGGRGQGQHGQEEEQEEEGQEGQEVIFATFSL